MPSDLSDSDVRSVERWCVVARWLSCIKLDCRLSLFAKLANLLDWSNTNVVGSTDRRWLSIDAPTHARSLARVLVDIIVSFNEQSIYACLLEAGDRQMSFSEPNNESTCQMSDTHSSVDNVFSPASLQATASQHLRLSPDFRKYSD